MEKSQIKKNFWVCALESEKYGICQAFVREFYVVFIKLPA